MFSSLLLPLVLVASAVGHQVSHREAIMRILAYQYDISSLSACTLSDDDEISYFRTPKKFIDDLTCTLKTRVDIGVFSVKVETLKYNVSYGTQMMIADQQGVRSFSGPEIPETFILFAPFYFLYGGTSEQDSGFEFKLTKNYMACEMLRTLLPGDEPVFLYNNGEPHRPSKAHEFCEIRLKSHKKGFHVKATVVYADLKTSGRLMINTNGPHTPHAGTALRVLTEKVSAETYLSMYETLSFYFESGIEDGSIFTISAELVPTRNI